MPQAQSPTRSRRPWFVALALLALALGYFGVRAWIRSHVDGVIESAVGQPLPQFTLADRTGRTWSTADLRGRRVVLHFFRSRCASCDVEAPDMRELERKLPADAVMLHVMTDRVLDFPQQDTEQTLAHKQFVRPVLMADAAFVDAFHRVTWSQVTPITYLVDAAGTITHGLRGRQTAAAVLALL